MSVFNLTPQKLALIVATIKNKNCRNILECGSGRSTQLFDLLIHDNLMTRCDSFEHLPQFAPKTIHAQVHILPIVDGFYDCEPINFPYKHDFLLIDGPPAYTSNLPTSRRNAFSKCEKFLDSTAVVVIDDYERKQEQEMINRLVSQGIFKNLSVHCFGNTAMAIAHFSR